MIKANSLLYAIYICLIVSIICGALLYFANLYNQLNLYYNLQEELYIQNQSLVNYALGNKLAQEELQPEENSAIVGNYSVKQYGLLTLLVAQSSIRNDTVTSTHFVGNFDKDNTAIYLSNFSKSLSYSGNVKLVGNLQLPSSYIETSYINNQLNELKNQGETTISEIKLPKINPNFKNVFEMTKAKQTNLDELEKINDSIYFNSFKNDTKEIYFPNSTISNKIFKGNFILSSKDSLRVQKSAILEDVILIAPKITIEEGFKGNIQVFATKGIELEQKVTLYYPSIVCVYNECKNDQTAKIKIKKECKIAGAIVIFGNLIDKIDKNSIEIDEKGTFFTDIYCSGKLMIKSDIAGSIYTNRFFYKTGSTNYDNLIANVEINPSKKPDYFMSIPLFETKTTQYGILKKVL